MESSYASTIFPTAPLPRIQFPNRLYPDRRPITPPPDLTSTDRGIVDKDDEMNFRYNHREALVISTGLPLLHSMAKDVGDLHKRCSPRDVSYTPASRTEMAKVVVEKILNDWVNRPIDEIEATVPIDEIEATVPKDRMTKAIYTSLKREEHVRMFKDWYMADLDTYIMTWLAGLHDLL